jgi:hypothetical protein
MMEFSGSLLPAATELLTDGNLNNPHKKGALIRPLDKAQS